MSSYPPAPWGLLPLQVIPVEAVVEFLKKGQSMSQLIRDNLLAPQNRMKQYADKKMSDRLFEEENRVYLKLQPYRQTSSSKLQGIMGHIR